MAEGMLPDRTIDLPGPRTDDEIGRVIASGTPH